MIILYRVVIVEDDRIIRKSIVQSDWSSINAEVVGEAADGQQALEVVEETKPHLVVTDIHMPFMDGVTFAKQLRQKDSAVRIIFLTGFDDFTYVHEAMLIKSDDYLLKPVLQEDLLAKAETALESWQQEYYRNERLIDSLPLLQEKFLSKVLFEGDTTDQIDLQQELFYLNIYLSGPDYIVLDVTALDYEGEKSLYHYLEPWQRANEIEVISHQPDEVFLILSVKKGQTAWLEQLKFDIKKTLTKSMDSTILIAESKLYSEMQNLETAILEVKTALEILKFENTLGNDVNVTESFNPTHNQLENLERTKTFINVLLSERFPLTETKRLSFNVVLYLCSVINQNIKEQDERLKMDQVSQSMLQANSHDEILMIIDPLLERWEDEIIHTQTESQSESIVSQAQQFMQENYMNSDLSLVRLANEVHVTSPYLSNLFKIETGKNFTQYLLELRMEKAKELLRTTSLRTYEIADQVGYLNPHYFSSSFKKYSEETPIEYRKKLK